MGLVHGDEAYTDAAQHAKGRARRKSFGRDVEQTQTTRLQCLPNLGRLFVGIARGKRAGLDPRRPERSDLIAHQGNEGGYDHGHTLAHQRRDLKAQGFAASSGHDSQRVAAGGDGVNDLFLPGTKGIESEHIAQKRGGAWHETPVRFDYICSYKRFFILRLGEQALEISKMPQRC